MREWLSGGAPPCQGGGRGFDPRLALFSCHEFRGIFQRKCFSLRHFRYFYAFEKVGTFEDILGTVSFLLWNASSKCNLKNSKGLGCFPTSQMAKLVRGIYLHTACQFAKPVRFCIACYFCDSITVSCCETCEKHDLRWILEGKGGIFSG